MARVVLGSGSTRLNGHTPILGFTLSAVLAELQVSHDETKLHNAGNDAAYTLLALFKLAIRRSEARTLSQPELTNLEHLGRLTL
jgi:hypothetical protein